VAMSSTNAFALLVAPVISLPDNDIKLVSTGARTSIYLGLA